MKNNIKKNFIFNTIGSVLYSVTSLIFMIIVTRKNGIDESGIFTFAFSTAGLLWVIGSYCGRVYQVTERDKKILDSDFIYNKITTCLIMIVIGLIFINIKKYNSYKSIVIELLIIYKSINAFSDSIYAIMQKEEQLYKVGISLFIKAILEIIIFIIINILIKNLIVSSFSLIIIEILILITYDIKNLKNYKLSFGKYNNYNNKLLLKKGFPIFIITILTQYLINAPKYSIDIYLSNREQSIYGILSMIATFTVLISQMIIHPYINSMNEDLKKNSITQFHKLVKKICLTTLVIGLIEIIGGYLIGAEFLEILYGINFKKHSYLIVIILLGSILYSIVCILSNALITLREIKIQTKLFITDSIITYFVSDILVKNYNLSGAAYTYLISMLLLALLMVIIYVIKKRGFGKNENKYNYSGV